MKTYTLTVALSVFCGMIIGSIMLHRSPVISHSAHAQDAATASVDLANLQAQIDALKKVVPDQAHAMQDVDYHFTNLWFAGQHGNWPLALFYFNESKSHLRWAVRIIPIRKDNSGKEIKLEDILQAMENGPLKQLEEAIATKDRDKFVASYEFTLTTCYSCHKAADKPYLRPRIPEHPATTIMNIDPQATWPK